MTIAELFRTPLANLPAQEKGTVQDLVRKLNETDDEVEQLYGQLITLMAERDRRKQDA